MLNLVKLLFFITVMSNTATASEVLEKICKDSVTQQGSYIYRDKLNFYQGLESVYVFGKSRTIGGFITVNSPVGVQEVRLKENPKDIYEDGENLFVLLSNRIDIYNRFEMKKVDSIITTTKLITEDHQEAYELEIYKNKLYVAHGSFGLSIINLETKTLEREYIFELPHKKSHISEATGLAISNDKIFLTFDNVTYNFQTKKRAFEGILVADLNLNIIKITSINAKREALHKPSLTIRDGYLYSQNLHHIYLYDLKTVTRDKYFWPKRRLYNFNGKNLNSAPIIGDKVIIGCFEEYLNSENRLEALYQEFQL